MAGTWMKEPAAYQGLTMRCAPGLHEAAMGLLTRHSVRPCAALDLASGTGAWVKRLMDHGFGDITAVEVDSKAFGVAGITPLPLDLDEDFSKPIGRTFGLVSAIEIVEHLENPRHFLRTIHALLDAKGMLLLSTPNVASWHGRLKFLLRGELRGFEEGNYHFQRHMSPLTWPQMTCLLEETGFRMVEGLTAGEFFGPFKMAATLPLWLPQRVLFGPKVMGEACVMLLAKDTPRGKQLFRS